MRKTVVSILGALLLLAAPKTSAQISNIDGVWSFGGGFTMQSLSGESADKAKALGFESMPGFYFGVALDYPFSSIEGLTVEPGLNIVHYGKSFTFGNSSEKKNKSYHCNYINVPVNLKYTFPTNSSGFGLSVFTGPRLNLGVGGNSFSTGNTYPSIRPIDAQWGIGLGVTIADAIVARVGYDFGLTKCLKDNKDIGYDGEIAYRNSLTIGVSFLFK
ncbi:MAG: PorT family protein [Bacteroidales bacterium]|nr:PorT family protein [Bacteroidales bacterium]